MNSTFSDRDEAYMREAIALATRGEGRVSPNPPVGCVLVRDGQVVGRGWHDRLGGLHAEAMALREAGQNARGATAYVTLSPCTTHGRQPPCSLALMKAGVEKVIVAAPDPNPHNSHGVEDLKAAGIPSVSGLLRREAEYLARGFFKKVRTGIPYVTVKYAMTLDGRIAAKTGDSRWISGEESREWVQDFRSRSDAVLVGSGTALADDPRLNVRGAVWDARCECGEHKQPLRVVVDGSFRTPPESAMLHDGGGSVLIAGVRGKNPDGAAALREAGADVAEFDGDGDGKTPLAEVLKELGYRGVNMALCEGGGGLIGALLDQGLADEAAVFIAPKIIGGIDAPGPVGGKGQLKMADAWRLDVLERREFGEDIMIRGPIVLHGTP